MENLIICLTVLAAACVFAWWKCAPPRSALWQIVEHWGADNRAANLVREERRRTRRASATGADKPAAAGAYTPEQFDRRTLTRRRLFDSPTVTQLDNGREYMVEKGGV